MSAALVARTIVAANKEWDKYDSCDYEAFKRLEPTVRPEGKRLRDTHPHT